MSGPTSRCLSRSLIPRTLWLWLRLCHFCEVHLLGHSFKKKSRDPPCFANSNHSVTEFIVHIFLKMNFLCFWLRSKVRIKCKTTQYSKETSREVRIQLNFRLSQNPRKWQWKRSVKHKHTPYSNPGCCYAQLVQPRPRRASATSNLQFQQTHCEGTEAQAIGECGLTILLCPNGHSTVPVTQLPEHTATPPSPCSSTLVSLSQSAYL